MNLIKSQEYSVANGGETLCKHVNSNKGRIIKHTQKPHRQFSVFGIKRHRTQFDFHVSNVSGCVFL